jgi:Rrf2 family protein
VRVSAKTDYAVRALLELAVGGEGPVKAERLAQAQEIPLKFLENILTDLRHAGIVRAQRGAEGGYWLARDPAEVTLGEVIRAVDGPLASVRGEAPEDVAYEGAAQNLRVVWVALRASMRSVVDTVTLEDVVNDRLPAPVRRLTEQPDAWSRR